MKERVWEREREGAFSPSLYWLYTDILLDNRHLCFISKRIIYIEYKTFNHVYDNKSISLLNPLFHTLHTIKNNILIKSNGNISIIDRLFIHTSLSGYAVWSVWRQLLLLTRKHTFHIIYVSFSTSNLCVQCLQCFMLNCQYLHWVKDSSAISR